MTTVLASAQLNITGTVAQRAKIAANLRRERNEWFYGLLTDKTKKNKPNEIKLQELQNYFKTRFKNIQCLIGEMIHGITEGTQGGFLAKIKDEKQNAVNGFYMGLPFKKNEQGFVVLDAEDYTSFLHEDNHLIDFITQPKYSAKSLIADNHFSEIGKKNLSEFYDSAIYNMAPKETEIKMPAKLRYQATKKDIKNFFAQNNFTSEEKIIILQNWRHNVKTEINAYYSTFEDTIEIIKKFQTEKLNSGEKVHLESFQEGLKGFDSEKFPPEKREEELLKFMKKETARMGRKIEKDFFFKAKLRIIEDMLAKEIKQHRQIHAKQLQKGRIHQSSKHIIK